MAQGPGPIRPASSGTAQVEFDDGRLRLTGYDLAIAQQAAGPSLDVAFYWQAAVPLTRTLKLSLRLLGPDGEALTVADEFPLHQAAPTWSWLPGEVLRDEYSLPLPINQSTNQPTTLLVIVYDADTVAEVGRWEVGLAGD